MRAGWQLLLTSLLPMLCLAMPDGQQRWFRGNTHAHTVLCGHADSSPEYVTQWYHQRGYNFLILSEHNRFINPDSVQMPHPLRPDFILIPGEEVSGKKVVHTTAMNISGLVQWESDGSTTTAIMQDHVNRVRQAGGEPVLNHPNYRYAVSAADILPVQQLYLFELYNGHPLVNNMGDEEHPSTEVIWDVLLSEGHHIYGVASDDAHAFQRFGAEYSNPGRGWVMVQAGRLTPDAITEAMRAGNFYASSGVYLTGCERQDGLYRVEVDEARTLGRLAEDLPEAREVPGAENGWQIVWIGEQGSVLQVSAEKSAEMRVPEDQKYLRVRISYTWSDAGITRQVYAWGQPLFRAGEVQ